MLSQNLSMSVFMQKFPHRMKHKNLFLKHNKANVENISNERKRNAKLPSIKIDQKTI